MKTWATFKLTLIAGVLGATSGAAAQGINAPTQTYEITGKAIAETMSCGYSKQLPYGTKETPLFGKKMALPEGRVRKRNLEAARQALNAGYNYAIMAPYDRRTEVTVVNVEDIWGRKTDRKAEQKTVYESLPCTAIDDETVFQILFDPAVVMSAGPENALVDLRAFIDVMEGRAPRFDTNSAPKIPEKRYALPGDRERISRQYSVKRKAAACFTELRPASVRALQYTPSAQELSVRNACLSALASEAAAVGWTNHTLTNSSTPSEGPTLGYTINRDGPAIAPSPAIVGAGQLADAAKWGDKWMEFSLNFPGYDGVFLARREHSGHDKEVNLVLASNTLSETALIERAIYYMASANMREDDPGVALRDKTQDLRAAFDREQSKQRADAAKNTNRTTNREMDRLQTELERIDRDLGRIAGSLADIDESEAQVKAAAKAYGGDVNAAAASFEMARDNVRKKEQDLKARRVTKLSEIASASSTNPAGTAPIRTRLSAEKSGIRKAQFRALEDYKTVLILEGLGDLNKCRDTYLVCADKLQAHAALGPKLPAANYTPIAAPPGYKPFDTTPRP